ncbi:MAG: hypothetical protein FWG13_07610 [Leptospirales bacterium]|nr:hypothetical protein [Leptospirales bacterium]
MRFIAMFLPITLLFASCSPSLSFIITAQYADRPILIGQYKRLGEKIDPAAQGVPFESKQGSEVSDFRLNKLNRDILMVNPKKTDVFVIQGIRIDSFTSNEVSNDSVVKGKILSGKQD